MRNGASRREGKRGNDGASDGPCSHQRLDTFADPLAGARHLDLGLVWCTGQAWICMLDLERDQLRPIVDIARGRNALRRACARSALRRKSTPLPSCHAARSSWGLESVDIRLLRATFVLFDTFLSSMRHHQVLCLACMLSVCLPVLFARCLRHISVATPLKPVVHGFLVKNGLRFVNKNIVVNFACVVIPDGPQ